MEEITAPCKVYWWHLPEHTDIFSQGYVGVTTAKMYKRSSAHKSAAKCGSDLIFSKAVRKYGSRLICSIILYGSVKYCYEVENKLRPTAKIGWNTAIGGDINPMLGRKHSVETKAKISANASKRIGQIRGKYKTTVGSAWEHYNYKGMQWQNARQIYETMMQHPDCGRKKIHSLSGISKNIGDIKQVFDKIKTGWNPSTDQKWLNWMTEQNFEEKEINDDHS